MLFRFPGCSHLELFFPLRQAHQGSLTTGETVNRIWYSGPKLSGDSI